MNTNLGLIGKKLGNTQIFQEDGTVVRVTAIKAGPCVVVGKRTPAKDGYSALQLGFGTRRPKRVRKPVAGQLKALGDRPAPQIIKEFRIPEELLERFEIGQELKASDIFRPGMFVDVSAKSKGRGFAGVIKRHNFAGAGSISHGTHEYKRHGGAIGMNMTPGRTLANMKMPGHYGDKRVTVLNLHVAKVVDEDNVVLVEGGVPGPRNGLVSVRGAVKKKPAPAPLLEQGGEKAAGA
ncbi:MAG: 50S ribosomal protein L3 [Myxococcota bacterium]